MYRNRIVHIRISDIVGSIGHVTQFIRIHKRYVILFDHLYKITHIHLQIGENMLPIGKTYQGVISSVIQEANLKTYLNRRRIWIGS